MPPPVRQFRVPSAPGRRTGLVIAVAAVAVGGCEPQADVRPDDIRAYAIPKNAEPVLAAAAPTPGPGLESRPGTTASPALGYDVPEGWTDRGAAGMRLATLLIGALEDKREVTVIPASGTLAGNVERWQGQLDPGGDAAAVKAAAETAIAAAETIDVAGTTATIVLLRSVADEGQAILGAMLPGQGGGALFVKFKGDTEVALRERERFTRFVSSIRWKE